MQSSKCKIAVAGLHSIISQLNTAEKDFPKLETSKI